MCNTFIGEWFLFGIKAAASSYPGMHSLCRTSTPCRRQQVAGPLPTTRDRFTVWQMTLPSAASVSFIPVINHLGGGGNGACVVNSSRQVDLSLNTSDLVSDAENSAAELENCLSQLHLSCDEWNCSPCTECTEQSAELSFCDEPALIILAPQTSTCVVSCLASSSSISPVHRSFSCSCDIWSCHCVSSDICSLAQYDGHTDSVECELGAAALSSFSAGTIPLPTENQIESYELFSVTDISHESATDIEGCYLKKDFTPKILFCSVTGVPVVSSVVKKS